MFFIAFYIFLMFFLMYFSIFLVVFSFVLAGHRRRQPVQALFVPVAAQAGGVALSGTHPLSGP